MHYTVFQDNKSESIWTGAHAICHVIPLLLTV